MSTFYIAGPMTDIPEFNFPAFDKARDLGRSLGYKIISPADVDRDAGFDNEIATQESAKTFDARRTFAERDTRILLDLRAEDGDGIALLPGWEKSIGAVAEFFLARWLGLKVVNALTFEPFDSDVFPCEIDFESLTAGAIRYLYGKHINYT